MPLAKRVDMMSAHRLEETCRAKAHEGAANVDNHHAWSKERDAGATKFSNSVAIIIIMNTRHCARARGPCIAGGL